MARQAEKGVRASWNPQLKEHQLLQMARGAHVGTMLKHIPKINQWN